MCSVGKSGTKRSGEPLFPQYLFGHFEMDASLHDVDFTRGIHSVLSIGGAFATVDDNVIALLRARAGSDGLIRIGEPLTPGDRVLIESGPFASLTAVVERILSGRERVCVLLSTVHLGLRVELANHCVKRLA
jgi:transcription antitermination factor NusG